MGPIAKSTIKTTFVLGLRLVVQAGTLLCVARMLGPEQFGAFAGVAALAVLMGTFATFGTHLVLLGEVSKDPSRRGAVLCYAVPTTLITGSLLLAVYLVSFQLGFSSLGLPLAAMVCIGITEMLILPLCLLPASEQLALEKTAQSQLLMVTPLAMRMLAALAVLLASPEHPLSIFANLYLATALAVLVVMKMYKSDSWLSMQDWRLPRFAQLKHSCGYATLAMTAAGPSELDKLLALKLMPLGASGIYAAASRVIGAAVLPVTALLLSAMPKLFRNSIEPSRQGQYLVKLIFLSVLGYGLLLAGLVWFVSPVFEILFGQAYTGLTQALQLLCLAVPGIALRHTGASILMTLGLPWIRVMIELLGMALLVVLSIAFAYNSVQQSVALAFIISEWLVFLCSIIALLTRKIDIKLFFIDSR